MIEHADLLYKVHNLGDRLHRCAAGNFKREGSGGFGFLQLGLALLGLHRCMLAASAMAKEMQGIAAPVSDGDDAYLTVQEGW